MCNDTYSKTFHVIDDIDLQVRLVDEKKVFMQLVRNDERIGYDYYTGKFLLYLCEQKRWVDPFADMTATKVRWSAEDCKPKFREIFNQVAFDELHRDVPESWPIYDEDLCPLRIYTRHVFKTSDDVWLVYLQPPPSSVLNESQVLKFTHEELENLNGEMLRRKSPLMFKTAPEDLPEFPESITDNYWDRLADWWRYLPETWNGNLTR